MKKELGVSRKTYRFLEMIPGLIAWTTILFVTLGGLIVPKVVAYFVMAFLVYWFYQSFKSSLLGINGYFKIKQWEQVNWREKYREERKGKWLEWNEIRHIVLIPSYKEPVPVLAETLDSLANQEDFDTNKMAVILAMEQRDDASHQTAKELIARYQKKFGKIMATFHPNNLPGEIIGKASNETWAAKEAKKKLIDKLDWHIKKVTVTSCDADTLFNRKYFSCLTYQFAKNPNRYLRFWQSPIFWYNNLLEVPAFIKMVGIIGNVLHLANLQELDGLNFNYSCYSLSLKLLHSVGYWDTDIIPEDWHIFLQSFFAKRGSVKLVPIFLPTHSDAPEGKNYFHALKSRYLQCQRHSWGATDIPYAISQAKVHKEIPLWLRMSRVYKLIETHLIWSTNWFILTLGAALPPILNPKFGQTSLGYNLPKFSRLVLTVCLVSLAVIITLDLLLRPKPQKPKGIKAVFHFTQWLLMPIATLFMSCLPGLDAQTKLMIGKRLEYKTTPKF